jgi:hypothetical protein
MKRMHAGGAEAVLGPRIAGTLFRLTLREIAQLA